MIRLIKKWWLVRKLHKQILAAEASREFMDRLSAHDKLKISSGAFILSLAKGLKKKTAEYESLLDSCIEDGYIEDDRQKEGIFAMAYDRKIRTTPSGDDFYGYMPLLEAVLSKYGRAWTVIIAVITTALTSHYLLQGFHWLMQLISQK